MADGLGQVGWDAPWYEPWRERGQRIEARLCEGDALHEALNRDGNTTVRFAAQAALPDGEPYERYIFSTGACPTRDNLHDFFNGLAWLELPRAKRQLNRVQAAQIATHGIGARRGPVRDAATLFDENGAVLSAPEPLWQALRARDWHCIFIELRPLWTQTRLLVVGHALLEKLVMPRKNLTAHVWDAPAPDGPVSEVDAWLETQLTAERLGAKPFLPLPVLGLPGWSSEIQDVSFYDDPLVFRPAGRQEPPNTTPPSAASPT
jgi:hypothetical protein